MDDLLHNENGLTNALQEKADGYVAWIIASAHEELNSNDFTGFAQHFTRTYVGNLAKLYADFTTFEEVSSIITYGIDQAVRITGVQRNYFYQILGNDLGIRTNTEESEIVRRAAENSLGNINAFREKLGIELLVSA